MNMGNQNIQPSQCAMIINMAVKAVMITEEVIANF